MVAADFLLKLIADWLVVPIIGLALLSALRLPRREWYTAAVRALMAGLIALFFAGVLRLFVQDGARPFELLGVDPGAAYLDNPGFPSDHTLLVFTITFVVWATLKNRTITAVLLGLSILVGVGRIAALVHTPADVLGGIACAFIAVTCIYGKRFFTLDTTE
jgi:membrane-associated phospholipid phosphatase